MLNATTAWLRLVMKVPRTTFVAGILLVLGASQTSALASPTADAQTCATEILDTWTPAPPASAPISITRAGSRLVLFGFNHSNNPQDSQFANLIVSFNATQPDLVFFEGPEDARVTTSEDHAIISGGESGLVRYLASQAHVPAHSFEPTSSQIDVVLLQTFTPEQVQMFYILRQLRVLSEHFRIPRDRIPTAIDHFIEQRFPANSDGAWPVRHYADVEAVFARTWPERTLQTMPASWFNPSLRSAATESLFLNDINAAESNFRNRHIYGVLSGALISGETVFATIGNGHLPRLGRALHCLGDHAP
jgi:hypothetical protein